ncbi:A-kinase anchor protein 13 isoform X1 [Oryzias melastigma]|uniref:A-kinase anchor protein 13 isoform X1 n=1 Tax=Oryzias melastigma TaxID=30732 RepID=UPI000CF8185C|nr:A-kinase anchor protein 13 isoform X1 [Oryzias melastigma]XP_036067249.1 A-kinase anchor protein 13 isoform X1 [Oryzias melastigma]
MKLNPQQAPLYGHCVVTVQLADEELPADDEEDVDYFLLFAGSTQRHLTSTLKSSHDTLQAMCPAHNCCEVVSVTLCSATRDICGGSGDLQGRPVRVAPLAEHRFCFVQDLAFDMAQFLVSTAGRADGLDGVLLLDECQIPLQECERLDESLALALHHLVLPPGWSLLGSRRTNSSELTPQETLLHFSARRGLVRVMRYLLRQPGAREALGLANREGLTPSDIAASRGHESLVELLAQADGEIEAVQLPCADARVVCHLPALNTHTLTVSSTGAAPTLQTSTEQLLHLVSHLQSEGRSVLELRLGSLHTAAECCEGVEAACQERLQPPASDLEGPEAEESGGADCSGTVPGNAETDFCTASEIHDPQEDRAGLGLNSEGEPCQTEEEEEGREQPAVSSQSLGDDSKGTVGEAEKERDSAGIPPAAVGCGKQAEEDDKGEAESRQDLGKEQEADEGTEEKNFTDVTETGREGKSPVMGLSHSSEDSDSEVTEREDVDKQETKLLPDVGDIEEEESANAVPSDLPSTPLTGCGDVNADPESVLIEGLHEGEPPPDINSQEQKQETAGRDYSAQQEWPLASEPDCHSGSCSGPRSSEEPDEDELLESVDSRTPGDLSQTDQSAEEMPSKRQTGQEHGLSSDEDEGSFRSFGSSSTELFHPSQDGVSVEDGGVPLSTEVLEEGKSKNTNDLQHPDVSADAAADSSPDGIEPALQLSSRTQTSEDLGPKSTEEPDPEGFIKDLSSDLVSEESPGAQGDPNVEESEEILSEQNASVSEVRAEGDDQPTVVDTDAQKPDLNESEETADQGSPEDPSQDAEEPSCAVDNVEVEPPALTCEAPAEPENQMSEDTSVTGAAESCSSTTQGDGEPGSAGSAAGEEENAAEEADVSEIHRDREASFQQPWTTQHSGCSPASVFPSLTSRASSSTSCPSSAHRDSGSDIDSLLNAEPGYDSVFRKNDEAVTVGDSASEVSVSCSSTDDTTSVGPSSSSPEGSQGLSCSWSPEEVNQTGASPATSFDCCGNIGGAGDAEDEAKDRVTEVPRRSSLLRNSIRSLSPLRRHSWGPGKNNAGEAEMNQRSSIRCHGERRPAFHRRSYSLEGLSGGRDELRGSPIQGPQMVEASRLPRQDSEDKGSLVSLTEEQEEQEDHGGVHDPKSRRYLPLRNSCHPMTLPLTKSVSMLAISHKDIDGMRSISSTSGSLAYSISEEEPGPLRSDNEGKSVTKVGRTFSYLKNKMYKKTRDKDRDKKDKEGKEKDKKTLNGHLFTPSSQTAQCFQCNKSVTNKDALFCSYCNASVHKGCRDSLPVCAKVKMKLPKQQFTVPDSSTLPAVTMRNKSGGTRERPWSAILSPDETSSLMIPTARRHTSIMTFQGNNLSKSLSISNIAGPVFDEMPIKSLRYLSQSTDSLNRTNQVTESMESLTDEGTEMMDGQLMGEFDAEAKELEADSWSLGVEQQYLQQLDKELVKRQDVIYELMQTEMHHIRTLRIMSEVYSKGLQKEVQLEQLTMEKLFPVLDELLELHTQHLLRLVERKKESQLDGGSLEGSFVINRIGDILINQFSGSNGESMKKVYGKFCSRHNEAVSLYKDLLTKDRRFKAFIKKKMSSSIVRRLGIPECILLVTQRITKYPVLIQRMLQHTKESDEDFEDLNEAIRLVKEVIAAVDNKVNEHEKRQRLKEFHSRMDSKSIMTMKNKQMFAREDLLRRRLIHDGALQLKNAQGRLKDVHALLLSDVLVFLQEKDQKYVFAMLDQRSTVISLQKLIVREVANKERGLFLITAGTDKPEMMEVLASSKEERNTWMQLIQGSMQSMEKDEDEGIPSETEDDKRQLEIKAREMREMLKQKDTEIMCLLEEKVRLFRGMWEGLNPSEEASRQVEPYFRSACSQEPPRGASIMKDALQEVETLQALVNGSLGGAMASVHEGGGAGPVCLPRRAETFGGFDSHQMHVSKSGDRDESEDVTGDLRRTESDSVLKKGGNANLLQLLKRNSEQFLHSVSNLHLLLSSLQAVVVQQDSFIEEQRHALSERSSSCSSLSRQSSRPSSLVEQEKQRSLEKQRQELASLQRQQAAHAEEKRRKEREWEVREQQLSEKEVLVHLQQEEEVQKQHKALEAERQELQLRKEEYQKDLERLRDAQRKLERDKDAVRRQLEKMEDRLSERTPSTTSDEFQFRGSSQSLELDLPELSPCSSTSLPRMLPQRSKPKGKGLNPFTSSSMKGSDTNNQISKGFLQLTKSKSKDGKKKKKSKGGGAATADVSEPPVDGEIFFC